MNKYQEIKRLLNNIEVVQHYLGVPQKHTSAGIWYKSPFRSEKTASFYVSNKGIHDFGSGDHYDIISFVQRYYKITPFQALNIICNDFGIGNLSNEYENSYIIQRLKKKREEEKRAKEMIEYWYNSQLVDVCNKIQLNKKCLEMCLYELKEEVLDILYEEQAKLEYEFEILTNASEQRKINMFLEEKR